MKKKTGTEKAKETIITKDMTIGEALSKNKNLGDIFMGFGMHCVSCPMSQMETIEEASQSHGIDLDFLIKKLNQA